MYHGMLEIKYVTYDWKDPTTIAVKRVGNNKGYCIQGLVASVYALESPNFQLLWTPMFEGTHMHLCECPTIAQALTTSELNPIDSGNPQQYQAKMDKYDDLKKVIQAWPMLG